jgi:hypothetical protein
MPPPLPSQTPPLPPVQPPHLPLEAGPPSPNPVNGQQGWNTLAMSAPPTYTHPHGMLYPPAYPPVLHHPPYASISAPPQPWGYTQYPMAPQPGPFLAHPLAAGDEDLHAHEAHGRVAHGPMGRDFVEHGHMRGTGGASTNVAAPLSTEGAWCFPNKEVSSGGKCHIPSCRKDSC